MKLAKIILAAIVIGFVGVVLLSGKPEKPKPMTLAQILEKQAATGALYLPADLPQWHAAQMQRVKPDFVMTGPTQALAFGAENFNRPFLNLSGMARLEDAIAATTSLFASTPPKTLLIAINAGWFSAPQPANKCLGMTCAKQPGDGYAADGAYHPVSLLTGKNAAAADTGFTKSLEVPATPAPTPAQVEIFSNWLSALKKQDIRVIVFTLPVASKFSLETNFDALASAAKNNDAAFYDESRSIPRLDDCEFSSGFEPGEILAKRLLLDMAIKDTGLQSTVKLAEIGWDIDHFAGRASKLPAEVDFLGIGCSKAVKPAE